MSPIPTNPDGTPAGPKPPNPPTSTSGVSGEPVGPYAPTREPKVTINPEPTPPYPPQPGVTWASGESSGLVLMLLGLETRLTSLIGNRFDDLADVANQAGPDEVIMTEAGYAASKQAEYDRGVADGRGSLPHGYSTGYATGKNHGSSDAELRASAAREEGFRAGKAIGQSEREAELLDQGWTPPGALTEPVLADFITTKPTDTDHWETALQIAGSQRNRRELEMDNVRRDAVWFYRELKAGPPPETVDPIDGDETSWGPMATIHPAAPTLAPPSVPGVPPTDFDG